MRTADTGGDGCLSLRMRCLLYRSLYFPVVAKPAAGQSCGPTLSSSVCGSALQLIRLSGSTPGVRGVAARSGDVRTVGCRGDGDSGWMGAAHRTSAVGSAARPADAARSTRRGERGAVNAEASSYQDARGHSAMVLDPSRNDTNITETMLGSAHG